MLIEQSMYSLLKSYVAKLLARRRSRLDREAIEFAFPSPQQASQAGAALAKIRLAHERATFLATTERLAEEISWSGPSGWRGR